MFTGIIAGVGYVTEATLSKEILRLGIKTTQGQGLIIGASVAVDGVCLTAVKQEDDVVFFDVISETLSKTTLGSLKKDSKVHIERSLKLGDELGGHLVLGHVDTTTEISTISPQNESWMFIFKKPINQGNLIAKKGSIAIDGVSLTVNDVDNFYFSINIIRHTFFHTNFQFLQAKNQVNLEFDPLARYIGNYLQNQNLFYEKKH